MSENPESEDVAFDSTAFEEWVEKTADSKDISRGEVLDEMLSSYWILEELTGMLDDGEPGGPASHLGQGAGEPESEGPGAGANRNDVDAAEGESDRGGEGDSTEVIRELRQLRTAVQELSERSDAESRDRQSGPRADDPRVSRSSSQRRSDGLQTALADLQERIEDLSEELSEVQETHDRDVADLRADVEETLETLEGLESSVDGLVGNSELESLAVSFEEELSRIEDTTTELDGRLAQLEEAHSETAGEVTDLADGHSDLEARLDREFDSIENLFQHLMDRTDDLEYQITAVSDSHEERMDPVQDDIEEREQLVAVMREAHRKGISRAVCENCETSVDLSLLQEPYCPECDRSVSGLEPGGWLPFDKPVLETEPMHSASEGIPDGSPDPSDLLEGPPDDSRRT